MEAGAGGGLTRRKSWTAADLELAVKVKPQTNRKISEVTPPQRGTIGDVPVYAQFMKYAPSRHGNSQVSHVISDLSVLVNE